MSTIGDLTLFDSIIALIFLFFMIRGVWIGFMRQLAAFLALVGSYWLAGRYSGELIPYVQQFVENPKMVFLASFAGLFLISAVVFILAGKVLRRVMEISLLGWFDRFLGLLLGGVKAAVIAVLLFMVLASTLSASNSMLSKSLSAPYLKQAAEVGRQIIHDSKLREEFIPKEPAIKVKDIPAAVSKIIDDQAKKAAVEQGSKKK
jgi:membrane protein required for colicin V production